MAISNSIDYTVTRDDIITEALELLGVLGEGESPNTDQLTSMSRTLNNLVKAWQADELNLFAVQRIYLFPEKDQHEYTIGPASTDRFTASFRQTTLSGDQAVGTTIVLSDDISVAATETIGVQITGTDVHWTTIASVTDPTTVEITDALPEIAEDGGKVFVYADAANRPMKVLEAYVSLNGDSDIPIDILSRKDYNELSVKDTDGRVNQVYFDPQINNANIFLWPEPSSELDYITLFVQRTLSDFDAAGDSPDFPQEWYMPLAYNLALNAMPKYGTPQMDGARIERLAAYWYNLAQDFDNEHETSMFLQPDWRFQ